MYGEFASIYDRLQNIDYISFVDYYEKIFNKYSVKPELILDLACGTGNITIPLAEHGYDMIGVDISDEMLNIAAEKAREKNLDILFLNQDMTEFELYGTVDVIICSLDGVNYLVEDGQLERLLALVKNYLNPNGIFIFDINSEYKLRNVLNDTTSIYDEDGVYCVWDSCYDENDKVCSFNLEFFTEAENGLYKRENEYQEERAYTVDEIRNCAEKIGLKFENAYADRTFDVPKQDTERIFILLSKPE